MLTNERVSQSCLLRKTLVAPVVLAVVLLISCSKSPGSQAAVQAKLEKEKLDLQTRKLIPQAEINEMKQRADAAAAAGMSQMEYKQLMERKLLEKEIQLKGGSTH